MIKNLISLANHLDAKGLRKEADYLDEIAFQMIKKKAQEISEDTNGFHGSFNCGPSAQQVGYEYEFEVAPFFGSNESGKWKLSIHRGAPNTRRDTVSATGMSDGTIQYSSFVRGEIGSNSFGEVFSEEEMSCIREQADVVSVMERYKLK